MTKEFKDRVERFALKVYCNLFTKDNISNRYQSFSGISGWGNHFNQYKHEIQELNDLEADIYLLTSKHKDLWLEYRDPEVLIKYINKVNELNKQSKEYEFFNKFPKWFHKLFNC